MRPVECLVGLVVLVGCGRGGGAADRRTPVAPLVPATGRCAEQLVGAGPVACPYPATARDRPGDLATPFERGGTCESAGLLRITSGRVVACDPLVSLQTDAFTQTIPPGAYPVFLATHDGDVTHALLRVGEARPVRWAQALLPGEVERPGRLFRYSVDSGTGSYVDADSARTVRERDDAIRRWCVADTSKHVDHADAEAWYAQMAVCEARFGPDLYQQLRAAGYARGRWANGCVDAATGANLIVFTSGAGDGAYPVFIGYAADGAVVALVTDFELDTDAP